MSRRPESIEHGKLPEKLAGCKDNFKAGAKKNRPSLSLDNKGLAFPIALI